VWERWKEHTKVWMENLKEKCHLKDLGVDGKLILKCNLKK
jgi:hypothetical protein